MVPSVLQPMRYALHRAGLHGGALSARAYASSNDNGPVYVVFGASGGIGSALTARLAPGSGPTSGGGGGAGAQLILAAQHEEDLSKAKDNAESGDAEVVMCNALDPKQVEGVLHKSLSRYGRVDGVANCIGNVVASSATTTSLEEFRKVLDINLVTTFNVLQASVKGMLNQPEGGAIVLVSAVAETGIPHFETMSAAKAGVEGLMRGAAATYAPRQIRVNCVAPGLTQTGQTTALWEKSEGVKEASRQMHAIKRFATPQDIAAAIAFLLSRDAGFITGQVLAVDGGLTTLQAQAAEGK